MIHLQPSLRDSAAPAVDAKASSPPRAFVVFNPAAGRRRQGRLAAALRHLRAAGWAVELRATAAPGDAERLARKAALANGVTIDVLVVAGGDGTVNEAVNGLLDAGPARPALALLPLGTANVLAQEIGLAHAPSQIARAIAAGRVQTAHIGTANGRCFTMMAGVGFDAHVVANLSARAKRWLGKGAYLREVLRQLFRFGFPRYRLIIDGRIYDAASAIVAKGRFYGGRHVCAPEARLDAAEFQVCLFERGGPWHVLRYALALALGLLPRARGYRIVRGRSVVIEGPAGDPVQGDGDIIARLPVQIELAPAPLSLVRPAAPG